MSQRAKRLEIPIKKQLNQPGIHRAALVETFKNCVEISSKDRPPMGAVSESLQALTSPRTSSATQVEAIKDAVGSDFSNLSLKQEPERLVNTGSTSREKPEKWLANVTEFSIFTVRYSSLPRS